VPTSPELYKSTFTYYTTPTTPPDLGACVAWISQVLNESPTSRVLIFDMTGASRAPAVAAAWLVASEAGMGAGDALARVTAARPGTAVRPEDGAMVAAFEGAIAAARAGR
jgi:protein-tyrosine phosphatase